MNLMKATYNKVYFKTNKKTPMMRFYKRCHTRLSSSNLSLNQNAALNNKNLQENKFIFVAQKKSSLQHIASRKHINHR